MSSAIPIVCGGRKGAEEIVERKLKWKLFFRVLQNKFVAVCLPKHSVCFMAFLRGNLHNFYQLYLPPLTSGWGGGWVDSFCAFYRMCVCVWSSSSPPQYNAEISCWRAHEKASEKDFHTVMKINKTIIVGWAFPDTTAFSSSCCENSPSSSQHSRAFFLTLPGECLSGIFQQKIKQEELKKEDYFIISFSKHECSKCT